MFHQDSWWGQGADQREDEDESHLVCAFLTPVRLGTSVKCLELDGMGVGLKVHI